MSRCTTPSGISRGNKIAVSSVLTTYRARVCRASKRSCAIASGAFTVVVCVAVSKAPVDADPSLDWTLRDFSFQDWPMYGVVYLQVYCMASYRTSVLHGVISYECIA